MNDFDKLVRAIKEGKLLSFRFEKLTTGEYRLTVDAVVEGVDFNPQTAISKAIEKVPTHIAYHDFHRFGGEK